MNTPTKNPNLEHLLNVVVMEVEPVEPQSLKKLSFKSLKRALDLFSPVHQQLAPPDLQSKQIRINYKVSAEYGGIKNTTQPPQQTKDSSQQAGSSNALALAGPGNPDLQKGGPQKALVVGPAMPSTSTNGLGSQGKSTVVIPSSGSSERNFSTSALMERMPSKWPRPVWHAPWKNYRVIRSYHGHLSGVYCLAIHPTIDILLTGGRDSVCRVWDIRSKMQIHALSGHENTVCSVFTRPTDPQVVTGSHDSTIKMWDLRYGKTMLTLTNHKKSVRAMAPHPKEQAFASASADNIKKFTLPKGEFCHNMLSQQKTIINAMAVNEEGVMVTGGDNGSMWFWDWKSGHNFQQSQTIVQPGSLDSEAGIYALTYDVTGTRLISCEADKTIKMWKEDDNATPETHPLNFRPPKDIRRF